MEIKTTLLANGKFNIILLNTEQCLLVASVKDVEYANVGDEVQKLLKRYF